MLKKCRFVKHQKDTRWPLFYQNFPAFAASQESNKPANWEETTFSREQRRSWLSWVSELRAAAARAWLFANTHTHPHVHTGDCHTICTWTSVKNCNVSTKTVLEAIPTTIHVQTHVYIHGSTSNIVYCTYHYYHWSHSHRAWAWVVRAMYFGCHSVGLSVIMGIHFQAFKLKHCVLYSHSSFSIDGKSYCLSYFCI